VTSNNAPPTADLTGFTEGCGYKADRFDDRIPRCMEIVRRLRAERVLDIGCGNGFFLDLCRAAGVGLTRCAGIEIASAGANIVRSKGYECSAQSAEQPFVYEDEAFDLVFAGEVIEHVVDPDAVLTEIHRVLAPGGALILTTPNLAAWFNRVLLLLGITPMFVEHSYRATYGPAFSLFKRVGKPVGHLRIFTWVPLREVLKQNGFAIESECASACLPFRFLHTFDRIVARAAPSLGANMIVLARKA
jgi:SAM-dependent methyltransferase